jgi:hypothetical protein
MKKEQRFKTIKSANISKFDIRLRTMVAERRNETTEKSEAPANALRSKPWATIHGIKTNYSEASFLSS